MGIGYFKNKGFLLFWALVFLGSCFRGDAGTATGNTCTINKTCEAPSICWNGSCKAVPCNNNKSCSGSLICQSSFCAPIYCTADSECPNDWYCESVGECVCVPSCHGKVCGDDGCGGSCGTCSDAAECSSGGECVAACEPECTDKACGPDGCDGECGRCTASGYCTAYGTCACDPQCDEAWECGDNGCGGDCGTCPGAAPICNTDEHQCVSECTSDCVDKECGDDGCGGECGSCPGAAPICNTSTQLCELECTPACDGKSCGPDGCGDSCGECTEADTSCDNDTGQCVCVPLCAEGQVCGDDGCEGTCGAGCDAGETCNDENECVSECTPDCEDKECGADGCGGECGTCPAGEVCSLEDACIAPLIWLEMEGDAGSATFVDSAIPAHTVSSVGNAQQAADGSIVGSVYMALDGDGDYLSIASTEGRNLGSGDFTIETWVRFSALPASTDPVRNQAVPIALAGDGAASETSATSAWMLFVTPGGADNTWRFYLGSYPNTSESSWTSHIYSDALNILLNTWYHLAVSRDAGSIRIFVNGHLKGTEVISHTFSDVGKPIHVGGNMNWAQDGVATNHLHGAVDDFKLYKGQAIYTEDFVESLPQMDADIDGYSTSGENADCDDTNAEIHPGAVDDCVNGVDRNCDGEAPSHCPSCAEILRFAPASSSGLYDIKLAGEEDTLSVYCDMDTEGGGWTVIDPQRASTWSEHFDTYEVYSDAMAGPSNDNDGHPSSYSWRQWFQLDSGDTTYRLSPGCAAVNTAESSQIYRMTGNYYGCKWSQHTCGGCDSTCAGGNSGSCGQLQSTPGTTYAYTPGPNEKACCCESCSVCSEDDLDYTCSTHWWNTAPSLGSNGSFCVAYREGEAQFPDSCAAILAADSTAGNGIYKIKPEGLSEPVLVYCDMVSAGGGWTLFSRFGPNTVPSAFLGSDDMRVACGDELYTMDVSTLGVVSEVMAYHGEPSTAKTWTLVTPSVLLSGSETAYRYDLTGTGEDGCSAPSLDWNEEGLWGSKAGPGIGVSQSYENVCANLGAWDYTIGADNDIFYGFAHDTSTTDCGNSYCANSKWGTSPTDAVAANPQWWFVR